MLEKLIIKNILLLLNIQMIKFWTGKNYYISRPGHSMAALQEPECEEAPLFPDPSTSAILSWSDLRSHACDHNWSAFGSAADESADCF